MKTHGISKGPRDIPLDVNVFTQTRDWTAWGLIKIRKKKKKKKAHGDKADAALFVGGLCICDIKR